MPASDVTVSNLLMGPGAIYIASFGAAEPADETIHDVPPVVDWTPLGGTLDGVTIRQETEYEDLGVDQIAYKPGTRITSVVVQLETQLAEVTLENLQYALGGTGTLTEGTGTAGVGTSGTDAYEPEVDLIGGEPAYWAVILDAQAPAGFRRRVILRKSVPSASPELSYQKDGQTVIPVLFDGLFVTAAIPPFKIVDQTAVPTS